MGGGGPAEAAAGGGRRTERRPGGRRTSDVWRGEKARRIVRALSFGFLSEGRLNIISFSNLFF